MTRPVPESLDWAHVRSFLATIENGSLSGAARALGLTQPTLGRHIQELEGTLGVVLFHRYQKGLEPTEAGRELIETAREMRAAAEAFEMEARGRRPAPAGTLRVAASGLVAGILLPRALLSLRETAPGLSVEIDVDPVHQLPSRRDADVTLRFDRPTGAEYAARRLGALPLALFAAGSWLAANGRPRTVDDLPLSEIVGPDRGEAPHRQLAAAGIALFREDARLRTDDPHVAWGLVRAGLGIGLAPVVIGESDPALERLDLPLRLPALELWALSHQEVLADRRIRPMIEGLHTALAALVGTTREPAPTAA